MTWRCCAAQSGSTPRAWGQSHARDESLSVVRFTPTGVGTIAAKCGCSIADTVHPHGRGDNRADLPQRADRDGSPPRAWGQSPPAPARSAPARFTPTGVGTILSLSGRKCQKTVHPHGRGDNPEPEREKMSKNGSPPRAWGQSGHYLRLHIPGRFTPTGVGTMADETAIGRKCTVHPHGRGDNTLPNVVLASRCGSPPRAWGQCCGVSCTQPGALVHPHGRGDNTTIALNLSQSRGSPPRAWGQWRAHARSDC